METRMIECIPFGPSHGVRGIADFNILQGKELRSSLQVYTQHLTCTSN